MSDSEDSNFSEDESERSSEGEEVEENEVRLRRGEDAGWSGKCLGEVGDSGLHMEDREKRSSLRCQRHAGPFPVCCRSVHCLPRLPAVC